MITVVCVYNSERSLGSVLLRSLKDQTAKFELVTIDNSDNRYRSAAEALNYGGAKAKGDYIMFVHQDVWVGSNSWLEEVEGTLRSIQDLGVAGVAGMSDGGANDNERRRWSIEDFGELWRGSRPVEKPDIVQTLDECLLIVPRHVFDKLKFDEDTFDGWDCYGADYCLSVAQLGLKAYVIPAYSGHSCLRAHYQFWEFKDLLKYQRRLYYKHKKEHERIYSWMGELSRSTLVRRKLTEFHGPLYLRLFPNLTLSLGKALSGCNSVLDLGCGYFSQVHRFDIPFSVGVERFEPYLQESARKAVHSQYIKADIRKVEFKPKSFDAVMAVEVLEHVTKREGADLLAKMETWARKKVVVTTPNGFLYQDDYDDNPLQEHKSGWDTNELRRLGFGVYGLNGWKRLRGYKASIKYDPVFFWTRISDLSQKVTYRYPKSAFQLLAIKNIDRGD